METIGKYILQGPLTNENAGFSMWGYATCGGEDYYIKEFVAPKYPRMDAEMSPGKLNRKLAVCQKFEAEKIELYEHLNQYSDGVLVRVDEFFRFGSKYYITMRRINALPWGIQDVVKLKINEKKKLCCIIAHGLSSLHRGGIVYADLKHENVLFMKTDSGELTAKLVDFDSSFLEAHPPRSGDDIAGDLLYFSPEACKCMWGEEAKLTCKMDIFALAILIHLYFTGQPPAFDSERYNCPGEAVANGENLELSPKLPVWLRDLLVPMLSQDGADRPDASFVHRSFLKRIQHKTELRGVNRPVSASPALSAENVFHMAGDL